MSRHSLARRLVGAGLVTDAALTAAVETVGSDGVGMGKALHDAGAIDDGVLHEQVVEQATDAVFDLLRWGRGDFAFLADEPNPDDLGVSLNVEEVITEGRSRLERWESLTKAVPAPDAVVSVALNAADETALATDEWSMLALIDGRRTVADLVRLTGRGEFATVGTLARLVDRKLVTVHRADDSTGDSVATLLRRQAELSRLEGRPEPVAPAQPVESPVETPAPVRVPEPAARPAEVPAVVPRRPEPIVARRPDYPEEPARPAAAAVRTTTRTEGSAAMATDSLIERDPSVNKSLLLRLIAGVRGL